MTYILFKGLSIKKNFIGIFFNLSKAYDVLDHKILLLNWMLME